MNTLITNKAAKTATNLAPGAARSERWLHISLALLTFVTRLVDSAGYLALGRVFTANMTGNVVLLGFAAACASPGSPLFAP